MATFFYRLYGFAVASDLVFPELTEAPQSSIPDIQITIAPVAAGSKTHDHIQRVEGGAVLQIEGVARFAVLGGRTILVDPSTTAESRNIRLFLLGSVMGLLLHQRGILPLHANAVEVDGKVCAFMGHSGAGKSTLAARFHDRGHAVISDDVCAVMFDGNGAPVVGAGLPRLRLRTDALIASGRETSSFEYSYAGDESYDKFDVPLHPRPDFSKKWDLGAIYLLDTGDDFRITQVKGIDAAAILFEQTYRGEYLIICGTKQEHFESCVRLLRHVNIYRIYRRWDYAFFNEDFDRILSHARLTVGAGERVDPEAIPSINPG